MSQGRLAVIIGSAVAAVAALVALTVVPVKTDTGYSYPGDVDAATGAEAPRCGDVSFHGMFGYSIARPLVDLWGFAQARDLSLDEVVVTAAPCDESSPMQAANVGVLDPSCAGQPGDVVWGDSNTSQDACDGKGVFFSARNDAADGTAMKMQFNGPWPLPNSSLARGQWCLDPVMAMVFGTGGSQEIVMANVTEGDLCLNLS